MHGRWRAFVDALPLPVDFAYPDTWSGFVDDPLQEPVPALFLVQDRTARVLMTAAEMNACGNLDELERRVGACVAAYRPPMSPST